jgi:hypothetical protein
MFERLPLQTWLKRRHLLTVPNCRENPCGSGSILPLTTMIQETPLSRGVFVYAARLSGSTARPGKPRL